MLSRIEVEDRLGAIRMLKLAEQKILNDKQEAIARIEAQCAEPLGEIAESVKRATLDLQAWAEANPAEFSKRKSIEFTHGTIGFRTGTPKLELLSRKFTWKRVLENVQTLLPNFIRDKPEIDKEALLAQRDEESVKWAIAGCGMKVVQDESFFVEPKIETSQATVKEVACA